jgi:hypothetical protein
VIAWQAIFVADQENRLIHVKQKIDNIGQIVGVVVVAIGPVSYESVENNADLGITASTAPGHPGNVSRAPLRSVSYSCGYLPKALASRAMTSTISSTTDFPLGSHPNSFLALIDSPNEVE